MSKLQVYLAGGFKSGWQDTVMERCPQLDFDDPRDHQLENQEDYTFWDLAAIRRSDVVFAYFERSNPAGFSLALEVGYAHALGKLIILVDEMSHGGDMPARYLDMLREVSNKVYTSLDDALKFLSRLPGAHDSRW